MISLHKPLNDCVVDDDVDDDVDVVVDDDVDDDVDVVVDVYCATGVARMRLILICHAGLRIPL